MKPIKIFVLSIFTMFLIQAKSSAQMIEPQKGYSHDIGNMLSMLDDVKGRIYQLTMNMNQEQTDFLLDDQANRIGAMIMHLIATEKYYQLSTFENRRFNEEEQEKWMTALRLGDNARAEIQGKPISYYLEIWDSVREETKELFKGKDDEWFASKIKGSEANNYWAWFHVMEHQSNHMGQIALVKSRLPK